MKSSETVAQVHDLSAAEKVKLCREALFSDAGPREVITRIAEIVAPGRKDPWGFDYLLVDLASARAYRLGLHGFLLQ